MKRSDAVRDVVVIGAGPNGLVAAAVLAKAGLRPLVLERSDRIGGRVTTSEIAPGFRCPTLAHRADLDPRIVSDLQLEKHGLEILRPDALAFAPTLDGPPLTIWADPGDASREIDGFSKRDAERYPRFLTSLKQVSVFLRSVLGKPPPPTSPSRAMEFADIVRIALRFRRMGRTNAYNLLRWLPMAAADFAHEWFESEPLCATMVAHGLIGSFAGPRSPGTTATLLLLGAGDGNPVAPGWMARGGIGAVSDALASAARGAGAEIRVDAGVRSIAVKDGIANGVVLTSGEEVPASRVVSSADPRTTLLGLVEPLQLPPDFVHAVQNIRMRGALAKVNFALSTVPDFTALKHIDADRRTAALTGCIRLAADTDTIERAFDCAKYGEYSDNPWIELTIPSITDHSLAPPGQHVVSAYVQYAPYQLRGTSWDLERERFGDLVTRAITTYAPGFDRRVIARQILTPLDLERTMGLPGGHIFHGELALDQLLVARPVFGWSRYRTPIRNLFLCGAGTHPGTGVDGRSGRLAASEILESMQG